jgi:hypothetical protein
MRPTFPPLTSSSWNGLKDFWGSNQGEIDKLARFFAAASLALTVAIVSWAVALGGTL